MHRKFITLIAASAIALTGFSAAPARADDDVGKFLAGLAALAILGAAIENNRDHDTTVIHRRQVIIRQPPRPRHVHVHPPRREVYVRPGREVHVYRPRPYQRVNRPALPGHCLRQYRGQGTLLSGACLRREGTVLRALPRACQIGIDRGHGAGRVAFEPGCLRQKGYRVTRR